MSADVTGAPPGVEYNASFLSDADEQRLLDWLEGLEFEPVTMRGQTARRTVRHYGLSYEYESRRIEPGEPFPPLLREVADRAAAWAGIPSGELAQALVTRYPPGATIGWHRDAPSFGAPIIGVSLGSPCVMRFRRDEGRATAKLELAPRSVYALGGEARWRWQHSIPPTKALRYSITFRRLAKPQAGTAVNTMFSR
jgi:alkylated DNA repair protein (DNA oxidative demethylase)